MYRITWNTFGRYTNFTGTVQPEKRRMELISIEPSWICTQYPMILGELKEHSPLNCQKLVLAFKDKKWGVWFGVTIATKKSVARSPLQYFSCITAGVAWILVKCTITWTCKHLQIYTELELNRWLSIRENSFSVNSVSNENHFSVD